MVQGVAVAAELVGGANPGEKKSCYRGEKGRRKRRTGRLVGGEIFGCVLELLRMRKL